MARPQWYSGYSAFGYMLGTFACSGGRPRSSTSFADVSPPRWGTPGSFWSNVPCGTGSGRRPPVLASDTFTERYGRPPDCASGAAPRSATGLAPTLRKLAGWGLVAPADFSPAAYP